jgi:hypothetical protein
MTTPLRKRPMNLPQPAVWVLLRLSDIAQRSPVVVIRRERCKNQQYNAFILGQNSVRPFYGPQPPRRPKRPLKAV